jgi:predicted SAM-dependent methyltransferase
MNLDLDSPAADIRMDLRNPLPFLDGLVSFVFAEHLIEHITRDEAVRLLGECMRRLGARALSLSCARASSGRFIARLLLRRPSGTIRGAEETR